jgi:large subunit ribosomal protein L17
MPLLTVFLAILVTLVVTIGLLWLISWLMRPRADEPDKVRAVTVEESIGIKEQVIAEFEKQVPEKVQESDDLKMIEGIGPKISGILNESGIFTFTQLAQTQVIILESILKEANLRIANPGTWPEQAALAAAGKWNELQKLQDELQGGREAD